MQKLLNFLKKIYKESLKIITKYYLIILSKIKESFLKCRKGEEDMKILLTYWCVVPCIIYLFILWFLDCKFLLNILDIAMFLLAIIDLYFIAKIIKIHPEYNTELMDELRKQELYSSLDKEQIKEEKNKELKQNTKNFFKKMFLCKSDKKTDAYKIVKYIVLIVLLITIKRIFL